MAELDIKQNEVLNLEWQQVIVDKIKSKYTPKEKFDLTYWDFVGINNEWDNLLNKENWKYLAQVYRYFYETTLTDEQLFADQKAFWRWIDKFQLEYKVYSLQQEVFQKPESVRKLWTYNITQDHWEVNIYDKNNDIIGHSNEFTKPKLDLYIHDDNPMIYNPHGDDLSYYQEQGYDVDNALDAMIMGRVFRKKEKK